MKTSIKGIVTTSVVTASAIAAFVGVAPLALADSDAGVPDTTTGASISIEEAQSQDASLDNSSQIVTEAADAATSQGTGQEVVAPAAVNSTSVGHKTEQVSPNRIDTNSKDAVLRAYKDQYLANNKQIAPSTGSDIYSCTPGQVNEQAADMVVGAWNFFRGMNNLDAVTIDPASPLSHYMQKAALSQAAEAGYGKHRGLSHHPKRDGFKCGDSEAEAGASMANLAQAGAFTTGEQVQWWYQDWSGYKVSSMSSEGTNDRLGHRNWLMDPYVRETAYGNVNGYNSLAVATGAGYGDYDGSRMKNPNATTPETMSWPSAGYFPAELLTSITADVKDGHDVERWSFRVLGADMSKANVSVTGPEGNVAVRVVNNGSYAPYDLSGYGTVLFKMSNKDVHAPTGTGVATYTVRVSGVKGTGQSNYYYQVKLFNAEATNTAPSVDVVRNPIAVEGSPTVPARIHAMGTNNKYQWQISDDQGRSWKNAPHQTKLNTKGLSDQSNTLRWSPSTDVCKAANGTFEPCPLSADEAKNLRFRLRATNEYGTTYSPVLKVDVIKFDDNIVARKGQAVKGLSLNTKGNSDYIFVAPEVYFYDGNRFLGGDDVVPSASTKDLNARVRVTITTKERRYHFNAVKHIAIR